ncbi:MAG: Ig-like domain-containing protein [Caldilineaceae bacterium]
MASTNGVFPELTIELTPTTPHGAGTSSASPLAQTVENALREVLAWRPRGGDAKGFVAALNQAFTISEVDGHTEFSWTPRSYAVQADLGAVTGAQASLYTRAKAAIDQSLPLLEGLFSLRPDADKEDSDANRALVRVKLLELVNELGQVGGPRIPRVDDLFESLVGNDLTSDDPATVGGLLGAMRAEFGFDRQRINTIDEEQNLSNYLIIVDHVLCLRRSWNTQKGFFDQTGADVFIGTQFVLISRALGVVAESVQELYFVLDSVFLGAAERQVVVLDSGLTIAELFGWVDRFASVEAPQIMRDSGKDGAITLQPTLQKLVALVQAAGRQSEGQANTLQTRALSKRPTLSRRQRAEGPVANLQDGFKHPRTQAALRELADHLATTLDLINRIKRLPPPTIGAVRLFDVLGGNDRGAKLLRIPPDSITPLTVNDQTTLRLVISGADFQDGATVQAIQEASVAGNARVRRAATAVSEPVLGTVSFMDARFILAMFDVVSLEPGLWRVEVINPDDQSAQLAGVFRIDLLGPTPPPSPSPSPSPTPSPTPLPTPLSVDMAALYDNNSVFIPPVLDPVEPIRVNSSDVRSIRVQFNHALDEGTVILEKTVQIFDQGSKAMVDGDLEISQDVELIFTASENLSDGRYRIILTTGILDLDGDALDDEYVADFTISSSEL